MWKPLSATLALAAALSFLLLPTPAPAAARAPLGPGGVLDAHRKLFAAMDARDVEGVRALLAPQVGGATVNAEGDWGDPIGFRAYVLDDKGLPRSVDKELAAVKWLLAMDATALPDGSSGWSTRIVDAWLDCPSGDASYATLELERTARGGDEVVTRRYRSTSLVAHRDGDWSIWHLHVSPSK
ncbi:MAG: hypothetical protein AAF682_20440 [Planctomycetota bacterium]